MQIEDSDSLETLRCRSGRALGPIAGLVMVCLVILFRPATDFSLRSRWRACRPAMPGTSVTDRNRCWVLLSGVGYSGLTNMLHSGGSYTGGERASVILLKPTTRIDQQGFCPGPGQRPFAGSASGRSINLPSSLSRGANMPLWLSSVMLAD